MSGPLKLALLDGTYAGHWRHSQEQFHGRFAGRMKADGFHGSRAGLRKDLGLVFEHVHCQPADAVSIARRIDPDVVFYMPEWSHPVQDVTKATADLRAWIDSTKHDRARGLVFYDAVDQSSSPFFGVLPHVDVFVKSQVYRDSADYQRDYSGGYVFADWLEKELGWDLEGWNFGSKPDPALIGKLECGWNFGVSRFYPRLARLARFAAPAWRKRAIDVNARFPVGTKAGSKHWEWYQAYRAYSGEHIRSLAKDCVFTGFERVNKPTYVRELLRSKIVFSPFGWGEMCLRDYEAVAAGALLVKPDVSHLRTTPDIFEKDVTYVATRWDLADLSERCRYFLAHPAEAEVIAHAGQRRLLAYFEEKRFQAEIADLLQRLGLRGQDRSR